MQKHLAVETKPAGMCSVDAAQKSPDTVGKRFGLFLLSPNHPPSPMAHSALEAGWWPFLLLRSRGDNLKLPQGRLSLDNES